MARPRLRTVVIPVTTAADGTFDHTTGNLYGILAGIGYQPTVTAPLVFDIEVDATGGTFDLTVGGLTATGLAANLIATDLQTPLLGSFAGTTVSRSGSANDYTYRVTIPAAVASGIALPTADSTNLSGGGHTATVTVISGGCLLTGWGFYKIDVNPMGIAVIPVTDGKYSLGVAAFQHYVQDANPLNVYDFSGISGGNQPVYTNGPIRVRIASGGDTREGVVYLLIHE